MKRFSVIQRLRSFKYAAEGIGYLFRTQHNLWIHTILAILAITLGIYFRITVTEWCFVVFAIGFVFAAEAFNTALETLTDLVSPQFSEKAKVAKDVAAAGVLIAAVTALVVGVWVFGERVWEWI